MSKNIRCRGKLSLVRYFQSFKEGDRVYLVSEPSVHSGLYHSRFYGKAGVAATYLTTPGGLNITPYSVRPAPTKSNPAAVKITNVGSNSYKTQLNPAFALGISYDLDQSWQMDLSWTRTLVGGAVGNMNFYALGFSYHFVDVYCGQFLCSD